MKNAFVSFSIFALAAFSTTTLAAPAQDDSALNRAVVKARANVDWSFDLYQNAQCTGATDPYSGASSAGCTTGIRNGNAAAFTKKFVDADCEVIFFSDTVCNPNNAIDLIDETTDTSCQTPAAGGAIASFQVDCN